MLSFRLFTHVSLLRFYRKWGLTLGLVCMVCGISFDRCAVGHLFFLCGSNQEPIGHAGIRPETGVGSHTGDAHRPGYSALP